MADPKSKVQDTIELLKDMLELLERDIQIVEANARKANILNDARAKRDQTEAATNLNAQISQIDDFIMNDADIQQLIGSTENEDVKKLNEAIREVLNAVKRVQSWEFKDKSGNRVNLGIATGKTITEQVVTEVDKLDSISYAESATTYDKVDEKIEKLETDIAKEEIYKKYKTAEVTLGSDVSEDYKKFTDKLKEQIDEYKNLVELKTFSADGLKSDIRGKYTLQRHKANVEKMLAELKKTKGKTQVTINGINKNKPIKLESITFDMLSKIKDDALITSAIGALVTETQVKDTDLEAKIGEMKSELSGNTTMNILFLEDRDKINAILDKKPINITDLETLLADMTKTDGKNIGVFADMETYKSIGDVNGLKKELDRLKELQKLKVAEEQAKGVTYAPEEVKKIKIAGKEIEIEKGEYTGDVVGIKKESELDQVMEATYAKIFEDDKDGTYDALVEKVEKEAEKSGNRLPNRFFSGLMSVITLGNYNPRKRAIEARVKGMIKDSIKLERRTAIGIANGKQSLADDNANKATDERINAFELDKKTREAVNAATREAARKSLIASRGTQTAEQAMKGVDQSVIDDAEKKAKEDFEGR